VLLFFGAIRDYKNLPELMKAFRDWEKRDAVLIVAGNCRDPRLEAAIRKQAADVPNLHLEIRHIPRESVYRYFYAADLVVLPYREILNSGTALLALTFGKPVLVPHKGAMAELQANVGNSWISTYPNSLRADILDSAMEWARTNQRSTSPPIDSLCWDHIAAATLNAYETILAT
jgi:glycosyltransferase involved in cell wall biosynthesis